MPIKRWAEECGALCGECALQSRVPVPFQQAIEGNPSIFVVGEGPGKMEELMKVPFAGESGMYLNERITEFEKLYDPCKRSKFHITNSTLCRPRPHLKPADWKNILKACQPRLLNELKNVPENGLVMLMGAKAMQQVLGIAQVAPWRGYPLPAVKPYEFLNERNVTIFPMFHPAFVLRSPAYTVVFRQDFYRALCWHEGTLKPWIWPKKVTEEGPEMEKMLEILLQQKFVGLDVETGGDNPWTADLLCVGVGCKLGGATVPWRPKSSTIMDMLHMLLVDENIGKSLHNENSDLIVLEANGIEWKGPRRDTLIWHRQTYAQLKHDLGFAVSLEIGGPRWKTIYKKLSGGWNDKLFNKIAQRDHPTITQLFNYNCEDAIMQAFLDEAAETQLREATF